MKKFLKNNILIIICLVIIIFIILFKIFNHDDNNIQKLLELNGYTLLNDNTYEKQMSKLSNKEYFNKVKNKQNVFNEYAYFLLDDNALKDVIMEYDNNISRTINMKYNINKDKIEYTYEISYLDNILEYSGSYKNDIFVCNLSYKYKNDNFKNESKNTSCEIAKKYIENFSNNINDYISDDIIKSVKNK